MKNIIVLLIVYCTTIGGTEIKDSVITQDELQNGGWQLSSEWEGYMGVSLQFFKNGSFGYWFYSDAKFSEEPEYPIIGKWKIENNLITLSSKLHIYDEVYYPVIINKIICLMPGSNYTKWKSDPDAEVDYSRIHFQLLKFNPESPHVGRQSYHKLLGIIDK